MWSRPEIKEKAKEMLRIDYWKIFLATLIVTILAGGGGVSYNSETLNPFNPNSPIIDEPSFIPVMMTVFSTVFIISLMLGVLNMFLQVGLSRFFLNQREEKGDITDLFSMFKEDPGNVFKVMFLMNLYIFLWSLLFVIPGIIKTYEYRFVPYILAENPSMDAKDVFARAKELSNNNKMDFFVLDLSFMGWTFLGAITIIGIHFVIPYILATDAQLYFKLTGKGDSYGDVTISADSLDLDESEPLI